MKKKILAILLAGSVVFLLAACGSNADPEVSATPDTTEISIEVEEESPEVSETETITMIISTEGMGQIATAKEGESLEFDDEFPKQSIAIDIQEPATYILGAKADEGWKFVRWDKDDEEYSTDEQITVSLTEDMKYLAVFDVE